MAARLWQAERYMHGDQRKSQRWIKKQLSRFVRRMVKQDPENAWRKYHFRGYAY